MDRIAGAAPQSQRETLRDRVPTSIDAWLKGKGELVVQDGRVSLKFRDGRVAEITSTVTEPTAGGSFQTALAVTQEPGRVSVSCGREITAAKGSVGEIRQSLMPLWVDAHCPG
jgi:hypothetical protein